MTLNYKGLLTVKTALLFIILGMFTSCNDITEQIKPLQGEEGENLQKPSVKYANSANARSEGDKYAYLSFHNSEQYTAFLFVRYR